jgi:hypothetical protein
MNKPSLASHEEQQWCIHQHQNPLSILIDTSHLANILKDQPEWKSVAINTKRFNEPNNNDIKLDEGTIEDGVNTR